MRWIDELLARNSFGKVGAVGEKKSPLKPRGGKRRPVDEKGKKSPGFEQDDESMFDRSCNSSRTLGGKEPREEKSQR